LAKVGNNRRLSYPLPYPIAVLAEAAIGWPCPSLITSPDAAFPMAQPSEHEHHLAGASTTINLNMPIMFIVVL